MDCKGELLLAAHLIMLVLSGVVLGIGIILSLQNLGYLSLHCQSKESVLEPRQR